MKLMICISICVVIATNVNADEPSAKKKRSYGIGAYGSSFGLDYGMDSFDGYSHGHGYHSGVEQDTHTLVTKKIAYPVPQPYPVHIEKHVPYPVKVHVPVAVPVDRPYPVHIIKAVPYPVEKHIAVPYEKPVPYPIAHPVPIVKHVGIPYPVPIVKSYALPYHHQHHSFPIISKALSGFSSFASGYPSPSSEYGRLW